MVSSENDDCIRLGSISDGRRRRMPTFQVVDIVLSLLSKIVSDASVGLLFYAPYIWQDSRS